MPSHAWWSQASFKKTLIWLLPLGAILALIALMKLAGNGQTVKPSADLVKPTAQAAPVKWQQSYLLKRLVFGQVEAPQTSNIGFQLPGLVQALILDEGEVFEKGQVLAKLDTQSLKAQLLELSAMQKRAKAEANLAALSNQRVVELVAKNLEPTQRLDESEQSLNMAKAYVEELAARYQRLQLELNKAALLAPFDGQVLDRLVDHGAVVNAGQTVYRLQQQGQNHVRFAMPTDYAQSFTLGDKVNLTAGNHVFVGDIKSISPLRRTETRTVDVIVRLIAPSLAILPGDSLHLTLSNTIQKPGIWVPRKALVSGVRGLWSLFVAEPVDDGHQLTTKLVEIIYADQDQAYVSGALKDADMIIINGVQRFVPGQKVQIDTSWAE